jgi:hypothetical protein
MAKTQKNKATSFHLGMISDRKTHVDVLIRGSFSSQVVAAVAVLVSGSMLLVLVLPVSASLVSPRWERVRL